MLYVYVCIHTCMFILISAWRQKKALSVLFYHPMSHSLETALLSELGANLAASKHQ